HACGADPTGGWLDRSTHDRNRDGRHLSAALAPIIYLCERPSRAAPGSAAFPRVLSHRGRRAGGGSRLRALAARGERDGVETFPKQSARHGVRRRSRSRRHDRGAAHARSDALAQEAGGSNKNIATLPPASSSARFQTRVHAHDRSDESSGAFRAQDRAVVALFERTPALAVRIVIEPVIARLSGDLELDLLRTRNTRLGHVLDIAAALLLQEHAHVSAFATYAKEVPVVLTLERREPGRHVG